VHSEYITVTEAVIDQLPVIEPPPTPEPSPTPRPTRGPAAQLETIVEQELGPGNRGVKRVQSVTYEQGRVTIEWAINDNLTEGLIKTGARLDILDIGEAVYGSGLGVTSLSLRGSFPLTDAYGNTRAYIVIEALILKGTADRCNWHEIDSHNVDLICDEFWAHPAFWW